MKKAKRIKDIKGDISLGGLKFKHPKTKEICYWHSQWGYENGGAGVWYKKDPASSQVFTIQLKSLKEALNFELA